MVVGQGTFDKQEFLKTFEKRFLSFCDRSPLFLKFKIFDSGVQVFDYSRADKAEPYTFDFDYSLDDKNNIKKIKDYLVKNCYPVFTIESTKTRKPDAYEIQDRMVKDKLSFEEASETLVTEKKDITFRVEKILNAVNSVVVRNMKNNRLYLYKARKPISEFSNFLFSDTERASKFFSSQCDFVQPLTDSIT